MNIVVTAGGIPLPNEPLYPLTQGHPKAFLDIHGKPMIQYVLDAIDQSKIANRVVVVGLNEPANLACQKPVEYLPTQGDMFQNIRAGALHLAGSSSSGSPTDTGSYVMVLSSDLPGINAEIVDWIASLPQTRDADLFYQVISREVMEKRYPASKRSYYWLKDVEVCGADIHLIRMSLLTKYTSLWNKIIGARKNAFQQAGLIGLDILFGFLFRRFTLDETAARVSHRLGIKAQAVLCPFAEAGMDIDKPSQYDIIRKDLDRLSSHA